MDDAAKAKLINAGGVAACLFLPYSVPCWIVAGLAYAFDLGKIRSDDHSGDDFEAFVMGAPVALPMLAYSTVRERFFDGPARERREAQVAALVADVAVLLEDGPVTVERLIALSNGFWLEGTVTPGQKEAFGDVIARIVERHPEFSLVEIGQSVHYDLLSMLDAAWAARYGFDEHAHEVAQACDRCHGKDHERWVFGREAAEAAHSRPVVRTPVRLDPKTETVLPGYVCRACRKAIQAEHAQAGDI